MMLCDSSNNSSDDGCMGLGLALLVSSDGQSEYCFMSSSLSSSSSSSSSSSEKCLRIAQVGVDNLGLLANYPITTEHRRSVLDIPCQLHIVIGKKRQFVCHNCGMVSKKMKRFDKYSCFSFCSILCMNPWMEFLLEFGDVLNDLDELFDTSDAEKTCHWHSFIDLIKLTVLIVGLDYHYYQLYSSHSIVTRQLLALQSHDASSDVARNKDMAVGWLAQKLSSTSGGDSKKSVYFMHCSQYFGTSNTSGHDSFIPFLKRIASVLQYNSHELSILAVPETFLLFADPVLSRINHSCVPNCALSLVSGSPSRPYSTSASVAVKLVPIRTVDKDHELTISYLADSMLMRDQRQNMLRAAFCFSCSCPRCSCIKSSVSFRESKIYRHGYRHADLIRDMSSHLLEYLRGQQQSGLSIHAKHLSWWTTVFSNTLGAKILDILIEVGFPNNNNGLRDDNNVLLTVQDESLVIALAELSRSFLFCLQNPEIGSRLLMLIDELAKSNQSSTLRVLLLIGSSDTPSSLPLLLMSFRSLSECYFAVSASFNPKHLDLLLSSIPTLESLSKTPFAAPQYLSSEGVDNFALWKIICDRIIRTMTHLCESIKYVLLQLSSGQSMDSIINRVDTIVERLRLCLKKLNN